MSNFKKLQTQSIKEWDKLQNDKPLILVGSVTCGRSAGSLAVLAKLKELIASKDIACDVLEVGCIGICYAEPLVYIKKPNKPGVLYANVDANIAEQLITKDLLADTPVAEYALGTIGADKIASIPNLYETDMFKHQVRRISRRCGFIDPENINHYIANDGYSGLSKSLKMAPQDIIATMKESGLRGRGGAGFPTWRKWQFCRDTESDIKYLVCNADEGDPGAYMNRSLLESDPHALLEGMVIAGFAIGASEGYIYCRAEYPLALDRLRVAITQAEEDGFLGENILNSGFDFKIKIKEGAGAFVCGEETALISSIEGLRGMPRPRPPFPAVSGLWGKPTIINNVETLCSVSHIMQNGAKWFTEYGTEKSRGTKIFALVGKVKRAGLFEIPLGTTLREMIFTVGGGVLGDKQLKAVQTGGPSGGSIPVSLLDLPIDYDSLAQAGTIMGSGGMVVMDEETCMVDVARYFLDFTQKESCGKCTPCRLGTKQMLDILNKIVAGKGKEQDIALLQQLCEGISKGSLCGLGQTAPNPVASTLRYFGDEYSDHVEKKECLACVCKALMHFVISAEKCIGCGRCAKSCPVDAITGATKKPHVINQDKCIKCGMCYEVCPVKGKAVVKLPGATPTGEVK